MRFKIMYIYMRLKRMQRCLYMRFKRMYIYMRLKRMQRYILYMRLKPMQSSTCALSACRAIFFYIYYILFFYICHIHVLSCPAPMVYTNNIIPESFYIQQNHLTKIYQNHLHSKPNNIYKHHQNMYALLPLHQKKIYLITKIFATCTKESKRYEPT